MKRLVVGLGEVLWDMLPEGRKIGGAPVNFAYHAGQFGIDTMAVSAIGNDKLGEDTIAEMNGKHLNHIFPSVPYPTGSVQVSLDEKGVPAYDIKENVAWDNIPFTNEIESVARSCRAVCFGSLAQRNAVSRNTIRKFIESTPSGCIRIFDINLRQNFYTSNVIRDSLEHCNILKINDEEIMLVSRMFNYDSSNIENVCRTIMEDFSLEMVILTCGTKGSYIFTKGGVSFMPTPKVNVADTVGAGDSFTGSFCAAILRGLPVAEAHKKAVEVSAYVCTQNGAMPEIPESMKL
jgi:fructokinase